MNFMIFYVLYNHDGLVLMLKDFLYVLFIHFYECIEWDIGLSMPSDSSRMQEALSLLIFQIYLSF